MSFEEDMIKIMDLKRRTKEFYVPKHPIMMTEIANTPYWLRYWFERRGWSIQKQRGQKE